MPSIEALRVSYNKAFFKYKGHRETIDRLNRAMDMLTKDMSYTWKRLDLDDTWTIEKHGRDIEYQCYEVNVGEKKCNCPDSEGRGNICKHRIAMELLEMAEQYDIAKGYPCSV